MVLKVMASLNVTTLTNVDLESIHVIKMLLASINRGVWLANASVDLMAMDSIARILMNVRNRM